LQQRPTGIIGEFDDLLQRGDLGHLLGTPQTDQKGKAMLTARKISFLLQLSSVPLLRSRQALLLPTHLEALTSNVTAANRRLSDVYRMAGSGCRR
jgi:hypothetical protein